MHQSTTWAVYDRRYFDQHVLFQQVQNVFVKIIINWIRIREEIQQFIRSNPKRKLSSNFESKVPFHNKLSQFFSLFAQVLLLKCVKMSSVVYIFCLCVKIFCFYHIHFLLIVSWTASPCGSFLIMFQTSIRVCLAIEPWLISSISSPTLRFDVRSAAPPKKLSIKFWRFTSDQITNPWKSFW